MRLAISIVIYESDQSVLMKTLSSLRRAIQRVDDIASCALICVDNSVHSHLSADAIYEALGANLANVGLLCGHGNIGFGRGHNLAIRTVESDLHLVLNPDTVLEENTLQAAISYLDAHPEVGLLVPDVRWPDSSRQYLCKRYPTVLDLALRGFAPARLRERFRARLDYYEMRDLIGDQEVVWDPPIVSGCFMLFRTEVLKRLGGFDPRYFLYFEDFDLSLRAGRITRIVYVPSVRIVHHGGYAARKGWRHIVMFVRSGITFFNTHGWKWS